MCRIIADAVERGPVSSRSARATVRAGAEEPKRAAEAARARGAAQAQGRGAAAGRATRRPRSRPSARRRPRPRRPSRRPQHGRGDAASRAPAAEDRGRATAADEPAAERRAADRGSERGDQMADISARGRRALRKATGAGMMDCKTGARGERRRHRGGQGLAAQEGPRRRGQARRARGRAGRGRGGRRRRRRRARRANCETDFVAKGDDFTGTRRRARRSSRSTQGDARPRGAARSRARRSTSTSRSSRPSSARTSSSVASSCFETTDGLLDGYKHIQNERGTIGVLVELGGVDAERRQGAGGRARHRAAHRVAPRRGCVRRDDVPADVVEKERAVLEELTRNEGKPENALAEDRRGPAQRLLQGQRACSSRRFVKDAEDDDRASSSRALGGGRDRPALRPRQDRRGVDVTAIATEEPPMPESQYRRVVLKLSGEAFADTTHRVRHRRRRRAAHRRRGRRARVPISASRSRSSSAAATSSGA